MNASHHITVQFNDGIPGDQQGPILLAFEKLARQMTGLPIEVFKDRMGDDSKLRRSMTPEQRARL